MDTEHRRELDAASAAFAEQLFARFPAWRGFAARDASGGLVVVVPSPTGDPQRALRFWIDRGEPSVSYGDWHTHERLWPSRDAWFSFLEDLVSDRVLFLVTAGDWPSWSVLDEPVDDGIADIFTQPGAPAAGRVVSWSGAHDRVVRMSDLSIGSSR